MSVRWPFVLLLFGLLGCRATPPPSEVPPAGPPGDPPIAAVEAAAEPTPESAPAPALANLPPGALALTPGGNLTFSARKNDAVDVQGAFRALSGWLVIPEGELGRATGTLTIDWSSVDTADAARDMNLRIAFFAAVQPGVSGSARLLGLRSATMRLEPGQQAAATALLEASAGLVIAQLAIPVTVERTLDGAYTLRSETGSVSIGSLGMDERKAALIALCKHQSIGDAVALSGALTFGP